MSPWLTAITALRQQRAETPGKEWQTAKQIAESEGLSPRTIRDNLAALIASGLAEARTFKTPRPIPHYRLRKIAKESQGRTGKRRSKTSRNTHKQTS